MTFKYYDAAGKLLRTTANPVIPSPWFRHVRRIKMVDSGPKRQASPYTNLKQRWASERLAMVRLYRTGWTIRDIANRFGVTTQRVGQVLKREGAT